MGWLPNLSSDSVPVSNTSLVTPTNCGQTVSHSNRPTVLGNQYQQTSTAFHVAQHDPQSNGVSNLTGRPAVILYINCDDDSLSEYQCMARKQIELFEAGCEEVESNAQGRNRPIVMGQVGIRCRHCTTQPSKLRARGAAYYPAKLPGKCTGSVVALFSNFQWVEY